MRTAEHRGSVDLDQRARLKIAVNKWLDRMCALSADKADRNAIIEECRT